MTLVGGHGTANPGVVVADLGIDSRLVPLGTAIAPGHHTLQLTVAHHGATRVTLTESKIRQNVSKDVLKHGSATLRNSDDDFSSYLAGVLASLQESSTEHVGGDLSRVGAPAAAVAQDRGIQAPQAIRVVA